ncbi:PAQR family membrane homeostasis protein TrhA [Roseovarius sp. MBR-51]
MIDMSYPAYSRAERLADGAVHIVGLLAALTGVGVLFAMWALRMDGVTLASTIVYSGALLLMLGASAAYHLYAHTAARPILRRLDHAAIYVKIAGTFTPLSVLLGTAFGYAVLALVWLLAIFGAVTKIRAKPGQMPTGWLPYVALGWIGVALFIPLTPILPGHSLGLLLAGGLLYTFGVVFYAWESLRFSNAIWHLFVALATACFFFGIASALGARL